jgi:hypothetical protein
VAWDGVDSFREAIDDNHHCWNYSLPSVPLVMMIFPYRYPCDNVTCHSIYILATRSLLPQLSSVT